MSLLARRLNEREEARDPIRVGIVGAGYAAKGLSFGITNRTPGMRVAAIANRTIEEAERAYREAGIDDIVRVETVAELEGAVAAGRAVVCQDPGIVTAAGPVEVVVEATGTVEFGANVAASVIEHGKHLVLINAELDSTLGPILKVRADRVGVVLTDMAGDQPGVIADLLDEVRLLGFRPILAGNIKSLLDPRRTPETQRGFAEANLQSPGIVTTFADGSKISAEMAVVANATGFGVARRGMLGPRATRVEEAPGLFPIDELLEWPIVDYIIGAEPSFGVFVLGYDDHPLRRRYMKTYKMGEGPVYTFYRPYHLSPLETPISIARAVLLDDPTVTPLGAPVCEVITLAKRDLGAGEVLDGIGGFTAYGTIENTATARADDLLPIGLAEGAVLRRPVPMDGAVRFADVDLPEGRLIDRLWAEQLAAFGPVAVRG